MGGGIAKVLLEKTGVEITGVCDLHRTVGRAYELLGVERNGRQDVLVSEHRKSPAPKSAECCIRVRLIYEGLGIQTRKVLSLGINASARRRR